MCIDGWTFLKSATALKASMRWDCRDTNIDFGSAQLWMVPGARHVGCYGRDSVAYMRRVTQWFDAAALGR